MKSLTNYLILELKSDTYKSAAHKAYIKNDKRMNKFMGAYSKALIKEKDKFFDKLKEDIIANGGEVKGRADRDEIPTATYPLDYGWINEYGWKDHDSWSDFVYIGLGTDKNKMCENSYTLTLSAGEDIGITITRGTTGMSKPIPFNGKQYNTPSKELLKFVEDIIFNGNENTWEKYFKKK